MFVFCTYTSTQSENYNTYFFVTAKMVAESENIEDLLRKCEKETTKYINAHRDQISALGKLLYEKKHLKSSEILSCIG